LITDNIFHKILTERIFGNIAHRGTEITEGAKGRSKIPVIYPQITRIVRGCSQITIKIIRVICFQSASSAVQKGAWHICQNAAWIAWNESGEVIKIEGLR